MKSWLKRDKFGLGFRVLGLGFGVLGVGFRVLGLGDKYIQGSLKGRDTGFPAGHVDAV